MPPFIIPVMDDLKLYVNYDINLVVDGQQIYEIFKDQQISVSKYEYDAIFLRFSKKKLRQMTKLGY
jgi:NAD kinase